MSPESFFVPFYDLDIIERVFYNAKRTCVWKGGKDYDYTGVYDSDEKTGDIV